MKRLGQDYFKKTSIAMVCMHTFMLITLGYCVLIMLLPNVAKWILSAILAALKILSFGDNDWYLFNIGFFSSCFGGLVLCGVILNIIDFINYRKSKN